MVHFASRYSTGHNISFGVSFRTDTKAEIDLVCQIAKECGASDAVPCHHWAKGGQGCLDLAKAVNKATKTPSNFQFLYNIEVRCSKFKFAFCSFYWSELVVKDVIQLDFLVISLLSDRLVVSLLLLFCVRYFLFAVNCHFVFRSGARECRGKKHQLVWFSGFRKLWLKLTDPVTVGCLCVCLLTVCMCLHTDNWRTIGSVLIE